MAGSDVKKPSTGNESKPSDEQTPTKRSKRRWIIGLGLFIMLWSGVLGAWMAQGRPVAWQKLLSEFTFSGQGSPGAGKGFGTRSMGGESLAYLGDGRAKLGKFNITVFDPLTKTAVRTEFRLEGKTVFPEEDGFERFMQNNNRQFREQVMVTLRQMDPNDLADTDLNLLERKLVSQVNRNLGTHILRSVDIKGFMLYESIDNSAFVETPLTRNGPH